MQQSIFLHIYTKDPKDIVTALRFFDLSKESKTVGPRETADVDHARFTLKRLISSITVSAGKAKSKTTDRLAPKRTR